MAGKGRKLTRRAFIAAGIGGLSLVLVGERIYSARRKDPAEPAVLDPKLVLYRNPAFTRINQADGTVHYRTGLPSGEVKLLATDARGAELIGAAPTLRAFNAGKTCTVGDLVGVARAKFQNDPQLGDEKTIHRFIQQAIAQGVLLASFQQVYVKGREPFAET